jgi:hypothetical protein
MNRECDGLRTIHKIADGDAFVRLMGLSRIAGAKIDRRRPSKAGRQTDVAVGAETRETRIEPSLQGRALKRSDEGMVGRDFRAIRVKNPIDPNRMLAEIWISLAHRRQMRLDLALHEASKAESVLFVRKILDIDDDLAASRRGRRMFASLDPRDLIWFGRSIKG